MGKMRYFDLKGAPIDKSAWEEKQQDDEYRIVRKYDNGAVRAFVIWDGCEDNTENLFRDMWNLFHAEVWNYDRDGRMKEDPNEHGKTFPTLEAATAWYEEWLTRWTAAGTREVRNAKGTWVTEFVEEDNQLAPPSPEEMATPETAPDDDVGAW